MDVEVAQGESGESVRRKEDVWRNGGSVVGAPLGAVRVDYCEASRRGIKETIGVKRSSAITLPLPKNRGKREIVGKKGL